MKPYYVIGGPMDGSVISVDTTLGTPSIVRVPLWSEGGYQEAKYRAVHISPRGLPVVLRFLEHESASRHKAEQIGPNLFDWVFHGLCFTPEDAKAKPKSVKEAFSASPERHSEWLICLLNDASSEDLISVASCILDCVRNRNDGYDGIASSFIDRIRDIFGWDEEGGE